MKNFSLYLLAVLFFALGCERDTTAEIIINDNSVTNITPDNNGNNEETNTINLSGVYTENLTLESGTEYIVTGPVLMSDGTTLSIEAGTIIKAQPVGVNAYIAIQQGAKIMANGTATEPVIMTSNSSTPAAGDWGGLVICGKAPINSTPIGSDETATSEVGGLSYGGNVINDDSGVLQYLRLEYAGGAIDGNAELNGLSLYAVGDGTIIDHIQVYEASDDGIEFFGGTVNASHIAIVNSEDDSIDWTEGYSGMLSDVYIQHGVAHDKAFECDGYNTDFSNETGEFSAPEVINVSIIGANDGSEAIRLRAGTQGTFLNMVISDFDEAFDLDGDTGDNPTGQGVIDGLLSATDITFINVITKMKNDTGYSFDEMDFIEGDGNGTGTDVGNWGGGWTVGIN